MQIRRTADGVTVGKSCWLFISFQEEFFSGNVLSGKHQPIVIETVHRKRLVWTNFLLSVLGEEKQVGNVPNLPTSAAPK